MLEPCEDIDYGKDRAAVQLDEEQLILGGESEGALARSLLRYDDIPDELKGGLPQHIDNVRYTARVEKTHGIVTAYWGTSYRIMHTARFTDAAKILKAHGIRCDFPRSPSIRVSLLSKPSGYITRDTRWKQLRSSWFYGAPVAVRLPGDIPTPEALAGEPQGSEEVRAAVISGDEDDLGKRCDKAAVGSEFDLWGESEEE